MANDRRIITGTHVVAKEGKDLEAGTKYVMDTTVGKSLGGKSNVTDMDETQWHASNWYKSSSAVTNGLTQIGADASACKMLYIRNLDTTETIYVSLGVEQTWDGTWASNPSGDHGEWDYGTYTLRGPNYDGWWDEGMHIKVPPGASIQLRGDGTNGLIQEVYARTNTIGVSANIEYVIAQ
jgi:hypothetical protein